ncbi:MAG: heat-inducible transcriptional repressor HrcA [Myxococcaceae bacterium]
MTDELGDREREVLRSIVNAYIDTGEPVGSAQLARSAEFDVSPATLRNVMSDLEALGFLDKPHTSAGRVPTDQAYRFYVDTLIRLKEPPPRDRELIEQNISTDSVVEQTLQEASRVLHFLTRHAGVVVAPNASGGLFRRIEFVRLRENRVLAVLVDDRGQVHNKPITVDFPITSEDLIRASNYLTELLAEVPFDGAKARIQQKMEEERAQYDALAQKALKLGFAATQIPTGERVLIEGTGSFLDAPEFADVDRMKALFRALEEKNKLLALLDRVQRARAMQIFIGTESDFSSSGDVSVIASPYGVGEKTLGTVGVIGPTRMNYSRVIPLVQFTALVLSRALSVSEDE